MKKIIILAIITILSLISIDNLNALTGYTTGTDVIIRSEPRVATETFVLQFNRKNVELNIISEELYNVGDTFCDIGWYKINYEGKERYVCGKWVSLGNVPDDNPSYNETTYEARIYGINIYVKSAPNSSGTKKAVLLPGTNLRILGDKVSGSGCSDGYYYVSYYKNDKGYVCSTYVRKKEELIASDQTYEQELKSKGFPETYIPYLVKLHQMHPNWKFNAIKTNLDWNYLVSMEETQNAIHIDFINDTVRDIYSNGSHETNFLRSTPEVNAFFLDPRNFLTEKFIFMFEALGYDYGTDNQQNYNKESTSSKKYYNAITSMLGNSYLNTDEYKDIFIKAGFDYKVSPIHLVGSVMQEGGASSTYPAITGNSGFDYNGKSLNGYYNYYNIGANGDIPVKNGLIYACGPECGGSDSFNRPWKTREQAIRGGAYFKSGSYISKGQNTLYFKKFDIKNFWHQYMTNITAPCSEGISAFEGYRDSGLLDSPLEFDIPIYNNMPTIVSLPEVASIVNTLNEIKVNGNIIPGYNLDVLDYTYYIPKTANEVNIEITKTDNNSTVTGIGKINIEKDELEHSITVTAENGSKRTYRILFIKVEDTTTVEQILNNLSVKVSGEYMNHISPGTVANTLVQSILKNSPNAKVTIYNKNKVAIEGASLLETGGIIKIIAPSGDTKEYTLIVTGDTNGDGKVDILDLLRVQKHILGSTKLEGANLKGSDTNSDGKIDILDLLRVQKHILGSITL